MNQHAELIARLRTEARLENSTVMHQAADALERLTAGDVSLPPMRMTITGEGDVTDGHWYAKDQLQDYGDRRDATGYQRGVLAERERCINCYSPDDTVHDYWDKIGKGTS
jgi:hypothetical protein